MAFLWWDAIYKLLTWLAKQEIETIKINDIDNVSNSNIDMIFIEHILSVVNRFIPIQYEQITFRE